MNLLINELDETLMLTLKHALFGTNTSLELILRSLPSNVKEYMLTNITLFANNLVDLVSKIRINTKGYSLLIKDIVNIDDPLDCVKIIDNNIFFKSNHLVNYSNNFMIKPIDNKLPINTYDDLVTTLLTFCYNKPGIENLNTNNHFYAKINFDESSGILKRILTEIPK